MPTAECGAGEGRQKAGKEMQMVENRAHDDTAEAPRPAAPDGADPARALAAMAERLTAVRTEIGRRIIGQDDVVEQTLVTLLSGGHALLMGVPGLGKTRLVETIGRVTGLATGRVQFTPDLMPADILGAEVLETAEDGSRHFRFIEGPVFCQLLLADEINRASPRTQSALLQAMQERKVTIAGASRPLPRPFHVLATQNPLEQEGTYPLPEAQLDRFLMRIDITHPDRAAERRIVLETTGAEEAAPRQVLTPAELLRAQALVRHMPVGEAVLETILDIVRRARPDAAEAPAFVRESVAWGPGPRAAQALALAVRARALLADRPAPLPEDVVALAPPILRHRMALDFAARAEGRTVDQVIAKVIRDALPGEEAAA